MAYLDYAGLERYHSIIKERLSSKSDSSPGDLKNFQLYNKADVLLYGNLEGDTVNQVTFLFNSFGKCTVSGKASANATWNYVATPSSIPDWIIPGQTYHISHTSTNVYFQIFVYRNGSTSNTRVVNTLTDTTYTMPSDLTGILIRLFVNSGANTNETITPHLIADNITPTLTLIQDEDYSMSFGGMPSGV